jgi:hypothetical protein
MTCFVAVAEVSNAWVVSNSLGIDQEYAKESVIELIKKSNGNPSQTLFIDFENYALEDMNKCISTLEANLRKYQISRNLYNIDAKTITKIISDFVENSLTCGLINLSPIPNLLRKTTLTKCIPVLKKNIQERDLKICKKYLTPIVQLRLLYSDPQVVQNVKDIVNRIYLDTTHKLQHSFFDTEGKRLTKLYASAHQWHQYETPGTSLMIAVGAFGYEDPKAILFLAFDQIRKNLRGRLEEKKDWRRIDHILPTLLKQNSTLFHFICWAKNNKIIESWKFIDSAPLVKVIPEKKIYLFKDSFDEEMEFILENIYPDLEYVLIV